MPTLTLSPARNPLGLHFFGTIVGNRLANQCFEGDPVNGLAFVNVDRAADVSVEARIEETARIAQRRAFGEGELHDFLVEFAGADDAAVRFRPARRQSLIGCRGYVSAVML